MKILRLHYITTYCKRKFVQNALFESMLHLGIEHFNLVNRLTCNTTVQKMANKTNIFKDSVSNFEPWNGHYFKQLWGLGSYQSCLHASFFYKQRYFSLEARCCLIFWDFQAHLLLSCCLFKSNQYFYFLAVFFLCFFLNSSYKLSTRCSIWETRLYSIGEFWNNHNTGRYEDFFFIFTSL